MYKFGQEELLEEIFEKIDDASELLLEEFKINIEESKNLHNKYVILNRRYSVSMDILREEIKQILSNREKN